MEIIRRRLQPGFTLIEVVVVLAVIGIIGVVAYQKWTGSTITANYEAIHILNDIRYAQVKSITSGQRYRWVELSSTRYEILNQAGTAILLPSGATTYTLNSGITIGTLVNLPNSLIAFDSSGAPYTDTGTPGTSLSSTANIPITGGGQTRTIQISPGTGYAVLQ